MRVVAYGQPERQVGLAAALRGLRALGFSVTLRGWKPERTTIPEDCDFAFMEGIRSYHRPIYEAYRDTPGAPPLTILEFGYLKRATDESNQSQRNRSWQVSIGNLGWVPSYKCGPERFAALGVSIDPLREPSRDFPIIVVGDHSGYPQNEHDDFIWPQVQHWAKSALKKIRAHTKRRVFWRPHPSQVIGIPGFDGISLGDIDWSKQWACVVFNSNTGNEALIKGCPVFSDGWAGFRQVSNFSLSDIENPKLPDRTDYFHRLANAQWFMPEIEAGIPFKTYIEKGVLK